jgi:uncharacterized PurR-regulated membrane protein YhhQ (DUF165 family)
MALWSSKSVWIVVAYLVAIVAANLAVTYFGPIAAIVVAFVAIGFDLTARDALHERWRGKYLFLKLGCLILGGSVISCLFSLQALRVSIASFVAFGASGVVNTIVYHLLWAKPKVIKVNTSNAVSAAVDSIVFPTIAFGAFIWWVSLGQFVAKFVGGILWFLVLRKNLLKDLG